MDTQKHPVGIHLRIQNSYTQVIDQARSLGVPIFQFFAMPQDSNKYLKIKEDDKKQFLAQRNNLSMIYLHSSYWINPATGNDVSRRVSRSFLRKEIAICKELKLNHIVLHAGTSKDHKRSPGDPHGKKAGIKTLARMLNTVLKDEDEVTILLENTAHANRTIGSDLNDFKLLRTLLKEPDKVGFCVDTAHAFAYGYDLSKTDDFVELLDQTMGLDNIKLIHFNDSAKKQGSRIDEHALPGQGLIGTQTLKDFINHPKLKHLPLILEAPPLEDAVLIALLDSVQKDFS